MLAAPHHYAVAPAMVGIVATVLWVCHLADDVQLIRITTTNPSRDSYTYAHWHGRFSTIQCNYREGEAWVT